MIKIYWMQLKLDRLVLEISRRAWHSTLTLDPLNPVFPEHDT